MTHEEIKLWRKRLGMTQQQAGDAIGVTKRSIQLFEAGDQPVSRTIALACAAVEAGLKPIGEE
jgi:DNA-binding XRE family transcriptional regulator